MVTTIKKGGMALLLSFALLSCSNDENHTHTNPVTDFPEGIISYNFPLGSFNLLGQSPIAINTQATTAINTIDPVINYHNITLSSVEHTSENLRVNLSNQDKAANYITIKGKRYELQQFHFHLHSEHTVNGEYGDMEIHFVNKSDTGAYAVLSILVKKGDANNALQKLIEASPEDTGINVLTELFDLQSVLPEDTAGYYAYSGSLTTPNLDFTPNQGPLTWIVFKENLTLSETQLSNYGLKYEEENFRVIQPLNHRIVYENKR